LKDVTSYFPKDITTKSPFIDGDENKSNDSNIRKTHEKTSPSNTPVSPKSPMETSSPSPATSPAPTVPKKSKL